MVLIMSLQSKISEKILTKTSVKTSASIKATLQVTAAAVMALGLSSCLHEEPTYVYMPDMVYQPSMKAQSMGSMLMPVKGTIPRDYVPYPYSNINGQAPVPGSAQAKENAANGIVPSSSDAGYPGTALKNPLRPTMATLKRGQTIFNTYCIVCHGPNGLGDGYVVPRYPRPPSLQSDKVRNWPDGNIYHVITMGQNVMPSYASQIAPGDRWAVIHYVRALQHSQHPTAAEVQEAEKE
jgi:mono/diheme cytochrome c family protein